MNEYEYISDYFNGLLSAGETARFDEKIQQDPAFAESVAFYLQAMQQVKEQVTEEKKKRFREVHESEKQRLEKGNVPLIFMRWKSIVVAAAVIIILCAIAWLLWPAPSPAAMADKYITENFTQLHVTMGRNDSMQTAADLYNKGKGKESLAIFEQLAAADSLRTTVIKNAGIVSLQIKKYDKAIRYFSQLENNARLTINPGKFYHALTLIKRNQPDDKQEAKQLLQQVVLQDLDGKEQATEMLKHW